MKRAVEGQRPSVHDFELDRERFLLVKRWSLVTAGEDVSVIVELFGGGKTKGFIQAFSLDSWVITGCYGRDVISTMQLQSLLQISPRYEVTEERWLFLNEKAKLGNLREEEKRSGNGLGVRDAGGG